MAIAPADVQADVELEPGVGGEDAEAPGVVEGTPETAGLGETNRDGAVDAAGVGGAAVAMADGPGEVNVPGVVACAHEAAVAATKAVATTVPTIRSRIVSTIGSLRIDLVFNWTSGGSLID